MGAEEQVKDTLPLCSGNACPAQPNPLIVGWPQTFKPHEPTEVRPGSDDPTAVLVLPFYAPARTIRICLCKNCGALFVESPAAEKSND